MMQRAAIALTVCLSLLVTQAPAASDTARIGLVLAGGGARGLAHVGVLRYLEEQHISIDAVAGTSMGAVIGGLYASGLSADQIASHMQTLDWQTVLSDAVDRDQLSFRRKQDDYDFLVRARLRYMNGRLHMPLGMAEGQQLNLLLHEMVKHVSGTHDFDALPIRYRAVAADIATGKPVVLDHGDLAVAMRASMSVPGFLAPIDLGGKLLVDGGIANNIPVDVAQGMGVDCLIVVDIGTALEARDAMDNIVSLVNQLTTILTQNNSERQLALMGPRDILIVPPLDAAGIATMDFDKADEAIRIGYEAARAMGRQLASLAAPETPALSRSPEVAESRSPVIDRIEVRTDSRISSALLRSKISQPVGRPLREKRLIRDVEEIYGLDEFSRVDHTVVKVGSEQVLTVNAVANHSGARYLRLGMSWDQDSKGQSEFGARASWRQKGINRLGAEWHTLAQVGGSPTIGTEFHQPLDTHQRFFLDAGYRYEQRRLNITQDNNVIALIETEDHVLELAPGLDLSNLASVRAGVFARTTDTNVEIGPAALQSESSNDLGYFAELGYDTLDRAFFPGSGLRLRSRYDVSNEGWGADAGYTAWTSSALAAFSLDEKSTLAIVGRWSRLDIGDDTTALAVPSRAYALGGFLALSGYTRNSLAGNYLGQVGLIYYRRLNEQTLLPIDLPVYLGGSVEAANVWLDADDAAFGDLLHAGSVFLGVDSPLGPVYLGIGVGENSQRAVYLQMGQIFD